MTAPFPPSSDTFDASSVDPSAFHDAVRVDPDASYERAAAAPDISDRDRAIVSTQLGRPARGKSAVVHRCEFGLPTVTRVAPSLDDGTPFPTVFWQTCPALKSRLGTMESEPWQAKANERIETDPAFAAEYAAASDRYVAFRNELGPRVPRDPSAGGMPGWVKCLHTVAAHHLATNDNPVGEWALDEGLPVACSGPCATEAEIERAANLGPEERL